MPSKDPKSTSAAYSPEERVRNTVACQAMEGLAHNGEEIEELRKHAQSGVLKTPAEIEALRQRLLAGQAEPGSHGQSDHRSGESG